MSWYCSWKGSFKDFFSRRSCTHCSSSLRTRLKLTSLITTHRLILPYPRNISSPAHRLLLLYPRNVSSPPHSLLLLYPWNVWHNCCLSWHSCWLSDWRQRTRSCAEDCTNGCAKHEQRCKTGLARALWLGACLTQKMEGPQRVLVTNKSDLDDTWMFARRHSLAWHKKWKFHDVFWSPANESDDSCYQNGPHWLRVVSDRWLTFWFLVCHASTVTQLATPLQQRHIQVVRSNKVVRKRLTESNGTPAMDHGHMNVGWSESSICMLEVYWGYGILYCDWIVCWCWM